VSTVALILSAIAVSLSIGLLMLTVLQRAAKQAPVRSRVRGVTDKALSNLGSRVGPHLPLGFRARTEKKIAMAGGLVGLTVDRLAALSLLCGVTGVLLGVALFSGRSFVLVVLFAIAGFVLPVIWLDDQVKRRHNAMLRQLPFHLDLLTMGVEAGLDFTAALAKMVEKGKPGPLREEFNLMLSQIRVGMPRAQAMRDMSARVDLPQLTTFLSALTQADKLGMSIGKVLRVQSESVRVERSQRAEKRANEAPVKILIPLVLFVFPTIWIILFAPMIFSFAF
jgi:tight adherence protein C